MPGLVSPLDPNAVLPQPAEVAPITPEVAPEVTPEATPEGDIPAEVLQIPAMQALMAGAPPALSAKIADYNKRPEGKLIAQAKEPLMKSGIGFYKSLSGEYGVLFNQLKISGQDVQAADKAGKLLEIAPLMDQVDAEVAKAGMQNPVFNAGAPGGPPMARSATVPPSGPGMTPPPAKVQQNLSSARLKALNPGSPTSGPKPGMGRLVNSIMKPVV